MPRQSSKGTCAFCGGTFGKIAMSRHVLSCPQRQAALETQSRNREPQLTRLFHLLVEGQYAPMYWLHLDVRADAKLRDLDQFLRDIWLECCGHLSAFTIGAQRYSISPIRDSFFDMYERSMNVALADALSPGMKVQHEYDFGTTTELTIKVLDERQGNIGRHRVLLLARNEPPDIRCVQCGKPATEICVECEWETGGWLCAQHGRKHKHEDMLLPNVNSPRVGMCGYTGVPY